MIGQKLSDSYQIHLIHSTVKYSQFYIFNGLNEIFGRLLRFYHPKQRIVV